MKKPTKRYMAKIGSSKSRRKIKAVRANGAMPCHAGGVNNRNSDLVVQRGRPRLHEKCGTPMKRLDAFNHYCPQCKRKVFVEKLYVRPGSEATL
jgi:hypothetical protein